MENREDDELKRLKRQFRIMNNDKNALMGAYLMRKTKQQKILAILAKERNELALQLKVFQRRGKRDEKIYRKIHKCLQDNEKLQEDIEQKKRDIKEVDQQIKELSETVSKLRMVGQTIRKDQKKSVDKTNQVVKCENKLETSIKQFCAILAENKESRHAVQSLLTDRKLFNEHWTRLISRFEAGKRILLDYMDQSSAAFAQREEAVEKLKVLKVKSTNKSLAHVENMTEMKRMLDLQTNLGEFLQKKTRKRIMLDIEKRERERLELARRATDQQLKHYTEILNSIKEFVGETDVQKIAGQYLRDEEENFALFNYVNELNDEVEQLNEDNSSICLKIREQLESNREQAESHKDSVESLKEDLDKLSTEIEELKSDQLRQSDGLKSTLKGLEEIFQILNCHQTPLLDLLGEELHIDENNVLLHLTVLETKLGSLSANFNFIF